ncbi:hypothetical protein N1028_00055 [Herbiconiux sp. CPCC 203407]|uniref:Uncharacterized protein n=1 Tax=Herbiconiux oxytropis TaxID=2970915 RepID=A0AA42BRZ1_9MICO|nr:hypothetical protein [Herbiconiux oxytropis]MCS5720805.1 hypothetical protein [Herbiconiux oxytropis]MCS5724282.1 hypothetical protein [Herbiconiux oxytropis]
MSERRDHEHGRVSVWRTHRAAFASGAISAPLMITGFGVAIVVIALGLIAMVALSALATSSNRVVESFMPLTWWIAGGAIVGAIGFVVSVISFRRHGRRAPKIATLVAGVISAMPSLILAALISASVSAATTPVPFPQSTYPEYNPGLALGVVVIFVMTESLVGGLTWVLVDVLFAALDRGGQ